ncbi:hypothetical protein ACFL3S_12025, partial [Gemmatimonadota bacterium]
VSFTLSPRQLSLIGSDGERIVEPGWFELSVGGKQSGFTGSADAPTTEALTTRFVVIGETVRLER